IGPTAISRIFGDGYIRDIREWNRIGGRCHANRGPGSERLRDGAHQPIVPARGVSLQQPRTSHHHLPHRSGGARIVIVPLLALALYAAAGFAVAVAFLVFGVTRVLPEPAPVTLGARIMLFPGTAALWPYVLIRWLRSSR